MQPMQRVAACAAGMVVLYLLVLRSGTNNVASPIPDAGNADGQPFYRKRLVAIGDLHGGEC